MATLLDFFKARRPEDFAADAVGGVPASGLAAALAPASDAQPSPAANPYADVPSSDSQPVASPQVASGGVAPAESASAPPSAAPDHFGGNLNGQQATHDVTPQQVTKDLTPQSERAPTRMERIADWYATKQAALEKEVGAAMQGLDAESKRQQATAALRASADRMTAAGMMGVGQYGPAAGLLEHATSVASEGAKNSEQRREQLQRFYESRRGQLSGEASNTIAQQREEDQLAREEAKDKAKADELAAENKGLDATLLQPEINKALPEGLRSPEAIRSMPHEEKKILEQEAQKSLDRQAQQGFQQSQQARQEGFQAGQNAASRAQTHEQFLATQTEKLSGQLAQAHIPETMATIGDLEKAIAQHGGKIPGVGPIAGQQLPGGIDTWFRSKEGNEMLVKIRQLQEAHRVAVTGAGAGPREIAELNKTIVAPTDAPEVIVAKLKAFKDQVQSKRQGIEAGYAPEVRDAYLQQLQTVKQREAPGPKVGETKALPSGRMAVFNGSRWVPQ